MQEQSDAQPHAHDHQVLLFSLIAIVGCGFIITGILIAINTSRRRRHAIWFRICRRCPALSHWAQPINMAPAQNKLNAERLEQLFPQQSYVGKNNSCRICLEDIKPRHMVRTLPCCHVFHTKCIDIWLTSYQAKCALCNISINSDGSMIENKIDIESQLPPPPPALATTHPTRNFTLPYGMPYGTGITDL